MNNEVWQKTIGKIDADFSQKGHEWLTLFERTLSECDPNVALIEWKYLSDCEWLQVRLNIEITILISHGSMPAEVRISASSEPAGAMLELLTRAINAATDRMGSEKEEFRWSAILVQTPQSLAPPPGSLRDEIVIGSLHLEPLDYIFKDPFFPHATASILSSSWGVQQSIPIRVSGASYGTTWEEDASRCAARELRSLCGVLSLCWEQIYEVGEPAAPLSWGQRQGRDRRVWFREPLESLGDDRQWSAHIIPYWLDEAWSKLQGSDILRSAVDAFLEAKYAEERHPSLAAVAYVSSIEALANRLYEHPRCKKCGATQQIAEGFRSALHEVLTEEAARELHDLYGARSKTVHAAKLHGGEITPGVLNVSPFSGDTAVDFRSRRLPQLQHAARVLLIRGLQGSLSFPQM